MNVAHVVRSVAAGMLMSLAMAAGAADQPEGVYQKLHGAALAGNVDEMLKVASAAQRAEISALPDRGALKFLSAMMPRSYAITSNVLGPDGKTARILATGANIVMGRTQPMYGEITLRMESGEWKVDQWNWTNDKPQAAPPAPAAPSRTAGTAAPARSSPGVPKPPAAALKEPKLRQVEPKAECVIKPVMTDEDIARCRAAGR